MCKRLLFILLLLPTLALAQVHQYWLKNGLRLIVKEDNRAPVVITQIWYRVGARYEPEGSTGISHALEHMMFRGSKRYGSGVLERIVAINGGVQNAVTDYDFTMYYEKFSADKWPISFALEADRMHNLLLRKQDFERELQVVMEERRMRIDDDPQQRTLEQLNAIAFITSPYRRPVIGWQHDLQQMRIADLRAWYRQWYVPNNAIVVVVGAVKAEQVHRLAQKYFGPIKARTLPILKPQQEISALGERQIHVRVPAKLPSVFVAYTVPVLASDPNSSDPYALELIAQLLSGGKRARFATDLIRNQQVASTAFVSYDPDTRLPSLFLLVGIPASKRTIDELKRDLLLEIKQLKTQQVDQKELTRIKTQLIAYKLYQQDTISEQASELGRLSVLGLPLTLDQIYAQRIEQISAQQIQAVARRYFTEENRTVAYLDPWTGTDAH